MPDFDTLFAPNPGYDYFALARKHPFEPWSQRFSLVNAGWLADCSLLVYLTNEDDVKTRLRRDGGFDEIACVGFDRPGAQCFIAHRSEGTIVCFRGTEVSEWQDLATDADFVFAPEPDTDQSGRVHRGFLRSLDSIWGDIQSRLMSGPIWFTGHSLGAALATLAADRCPQLHPVYSFGSPRVGDTNFREGFRAHAYRFVNNNDAVTNAPPGFPFSAYRHVGDLKYLDERGHLMDDAGWWLRLRAGLSGHVKRLADVVGEFRGGHFNAIPLDQLADHSPTHYAEHLWGNISGHP